VREERGLAYSVYSYRGAFTDTGMLAIYAGTSPERVHETLDVRLSAATVEIFQRGARIWIHARSAQRGRHTTVADHMTKAHRAHQEWSPSRLVRWGATMGPETATRVQQILESRPHPEQGYRSCLGLLRLAKRYGPARLNAACAGRRRRRGRIATSIPCSSMASTAAAAVEAPDAPSSLRQRTRARVLPRRRAS
jgi:transposase